MLVPLRPPPPAPANLIEKFADKMELHIISWNVCGVRDIARLATLKSCVYQHRPTVLFIQEAFVGHRLGVQEAPPLTGYISYVHLVRNGLISYIHSSVPHKLVRNSEDEDMTFQLFDVKIGEAEIRLCNVYSAPGRINLDALPTPMTRGMIYLGDFNARHPELGDTTPTPNRNRPRFLEYIRRHRLTDWNTEGSTHSLKGTLEHILTSGLVESRVKCSSVPVLFSDHIALNLHYSITSEQSPRHARTRISIPPKYCPVYISYMTNLLPTFNSE